MTIDVFSNYIGMAVLVLIIVGILWFIYKYSPIQLLIRRWNNLKYFIKQFLLMYSDQKSIFSKKRVDSGVAFYLAMGLMTMFVWYRRATIPTIEFMIIIAAMLLVAGYNIKKIQEEKSMNAKVDLADKVVDLADKKEDNAANLDNKIVDKSEQ